MSELDYYRDSVVWGYHEEAIPTYYQGKAGENEICSPVTAKTVNAMVARIVELENALVAKESRSIEDRTYVFGAGKTLVGHGDYQGLPCLTMAYAPEGTPPLPLGVIIEDPALVEAAANDAIIMQFTTAESILNFMDTIRKMVDAYQTVVDSQT